MANSLNGVSESSLQLNLVACGSEKLSLNDSSVFVLSSKTNPLDKKGVYITADTIDSWFLHDNNGLTGLVGSYTNSNEEVIVYNNGTACPIMNISLIEKTLDANSKTVYLDECESCVLDGDYTIA
jgi:hypothetical protein